jgi:hypothetical protein
MFWFWIYIWLAFILIYRVYCFPSKIDEKYIGIDKPYSIEFGFIVVSVFGGSLITLVIFLLWYFL